MLSKAATIQKREKNNVLNDDMRSLENMLVEHDLNRYIQLLPNLCPAQGLRYAIILFLNIGIKLVYETILLYSNHIC